MFSALRHRPLPWRSAYALFSPYTPRHLNLAIFANTQARHIATFFPGRMTGTPAEMLSADYIRQQFQQMGYRS